MFSFWGLSWERSCCPLWMEFFPFTVINSLLVYKVILFTAFISSWICAELLMCRIWKTIGKEFVYYFIALQFFFSFLEAQIDFAVDTSFFIFSFQLYCGGCFEENLVKLVQLVFHICGFCIHGFNQLFIRNLGKNCILAYIPWMVQYVYCLHCFKCYRRSRHDFHVQEVVYTFMQHYTIKKSVSTYWFSIQKEVWSIYYKGTNFRVFFASMEYCCVWQVVCLGHFCVLSKYL